MKIFDGEKYISINELTNLMFLHSFKDEWEVDSLYVNSFIKILKDYPKMGAEENQRISNPVYPQIPVFSWNYDTNEFFVLGHKFAGVNSIEDFVTFLMNLKNNNERLTHQINSARQLAEKLEDDCINLCTCSYCTDIKEFINLVKEKEVK